MQYASAMYKRALHRCNLHETLTPTVLGRNPASDISPSFRKTAELQNKICFAAALQLLSSLVWLFSVFCPRADALCQPVPTLELQELRRAECSEILFENQIL